MPQQPSRGLRASALERGIWRRARIYRVSNLAWPRVACGETHRERPLTPAVLVLNSLMADAAMLILMRAALGHELAGRRRGPSLSRRGRRREAHGPQWITAHLRLT